MLIGIEINSTTVKNRTSLLNVESNSYNGDQEMTNVPPCFPTVNCHYLSLGVGIRFRLRTWCRVWAGRGEDKETEKFNILL